MDVRFVKMKIPKYRLVLLTVFTAALMFFLVQMRILPGKSQRTAWPKGFELVDMLMQLIRNDYLEERDPVQTAEGAYRGIVNSLDPVSSYLTSDLTARYAARGPGDTATGLIVFKRYGSFPQVVGILPGSPAEKQAVKVGDLVSAIEHRSTLSMSLTEVELLLGGTDEKAVHLKLLHGDNARELDLARARRFERDYALAPAAADRPAILAVRAFTPGLPAALRKNVLPALKALKGPLVLDLRNASGGDLEAARAVANLFVKTDAAGAFEKKGGVKETVACPAPAELAGIPVAVWVNAGTIGPAEFVAGVLQEVGKAKVVGLATVGAVALTARFPLGDGSSVLLVSGVYSLPSGRSLWGEGLTPDAAVAADDQGDKAYLAKTLPLLPKI
jgi:carboxyl-terminal processing protease